MDLICLQWLLQVAEGDNGKPASLETLTLVPLVERQQCDGCASCITDVHRTCKECGYDACIRCCRGLREQGQVRGTQDITCLQNSSVHCLLCPLCPSLLSWKLILQSLCLASCLFSETSLQRDTSDKVQGKVTMPTPAPSLTQCRLEY